MHSMSTTTMACMAYISVPIYERKEKKRLLQSCYADLQTVRDAGIILAHEA